MSMRSKQGRVTARRSRADLPSRHALEEGFSGFSRLAFADRRLLRAFLFLFRLFGFPTRPLLLFVRHDILPSAPGKRICRGCAPMQPPNQRTARYCRFIHLLALTPASAGRAILSRQLVSSALGQMGPAAIS